MALYENGTLSLTLMLKLKFKVKDSARFDSRNFLGAALAVKTFRVLVYVLRNK